MEETRLCPYCEGEISATARKCKHCGEWISEEKEPVKGDELEATEESPVEEEEEEEDESSEATLQSPFGGDWHMLLLFFALLGLIVMAVHCDCMKAAMPILENHTNKFTLIATMLYAIPECLGGLMAGIGTAGLMYTLRCGLLKAYPEDCEETKIGTWLNAAVVVEIITAILICVFSLLLAGDTDSEPASIEEMAISFAFVALLTIPLLICGLKLRNIGYGEFSLLSALFIASYFAEIIISDLFPANIAMYVEAVEFLITAFCLYKMACLFGSSDYGLDYLVYLGTALLVFVAIIKPDVDELSAGNEVKQEIEQTQTDDEVNDDAKTTDIVFDEDGTASFYLEGTVGELEDVYIRLSIDKNMMVMDDEPEWVLVEGFYSEGYKQQELQSCAYNTKDGQLNLYIDPYVLTGTISDGKYKGDFELASNPGVTSGDGTFSLTVADWNPEE